jgi:HK97 family phage major capsid protein
MTWYAKDASTERDDAIKQSANPEIVKKIFTEIDRANDGQKANYEQLRKDFNEISHLLEGKLGTDKVDSVLNEQIKKYTVDITNRQAEMDTVFNQQKASYEALQTRMEELEVAFKRPGQVGDVSAKDIEEMAKASIDFQCACKSVQSADGVKWSPNRVVTANIDQMKLYEGAFSVYMRSKSKHPEIEIANFLSPEHAKALSVGSDPDGGYTVLPATSSRIIQRVFETDPIRQMCSVETISTGAMEWMVDFGEAGYGWESENVAGGETETAQQQRKRIPVFVIYAKPRATMTLLEDSSINIENWHAEHVARRFARGEGASFVSGLGIDRPRGFLTYSNVDTAGTPQWGRVEQINMGHATALTYNGFVDIKYSMTEYYLNRGTWLMNRGTVADALQLKDGFGRPLWGPGMETGQPGQILGSPVRMSTTMPAVAANALAVVYADWMEFYMIVDRLGITVQRDPFTVKPFVEFYTRKRVGGDVVNFEAGRIGVIAA